MVASLLQELNMSHHIESFQQNQVDGSLFTELDEEEFKDLGLNKFERKKLLKYRNGWRPKIM